MGTSSHTGSVASLLAAVSLAVAAAIAAIALLASPQTSSAQADSDCGPTGLGQLTESGLRAGGRWSTQGCESELRPGSDARHFEFEVVAAGRVRVELASAAADSFLYLFDVDGNRLADDDDGGQLLDARIEAELEPGRYRVEATTVGGRTRGPANFTLTVAHVEGCEIAPLGDLVPGAVLTASGTWSQQTCGSRIVVAHPAYNYSFRMAAPGRVRVDLVSRNGDPVVSMATAAGAVIGANDDGGSGRNSRIEQYLPAGAYVIEATTYRRGGLQPLAADFELTVRLIDERQRLQMPDPKVEGLVVPARVVAGEPFTVHYRVGNVGGGDLHETAPTVQIQGYGPGRSGGFLRQWSRTLLVDEDSWRAGSSYHTGDVVAGAGSTTLRGVESREMTLEQAGLSWVLIALWVIDEENRDIGFHSVWKHVEVIGGATFGPTRVRIDDQTYAVTAAGGGDGEVTTTVANLTDREAEVGPTRRLQAIYAAGVRTQLLDDVFGRPAITRLEELRAGAGAAGAAPGPAGPTGDSVRRQFAADYLETVTASGIAGSNAAGLMIDPGRVEDLVLDGARGAARRYAALASDWRALRARLGNAGAITYAEALAMHSQLRYAEGALAPLVEAGELVDAARAGEDGWDGPVSDSLSEFARQATCARSDRDLADALALTGDANPAAVLELDAELRLALPVYGTAADRAQCAIAAIDDANDRLLELLGLASFQAALLPGYRFVPTPADVPEPYRLRILARLDADGRVEHAVELANGRLIRPQRRILDADAPSGSWHSSGPVRVFGQEIGVIRSQRSADGRILLSFLDTDGKSVFPKAWIMPADASVGVWLRTSLIEVAPPAPVLAAFD